MTDALERKLVLSSVVDFEKAATVIFVGMAGKLAGFVAIADPIKATTPQALQALRTAGVRIVMLTGDGKTTAEAVGRQLGMDKVVAEVFPDDKAAVVKRLRDEGRVVAMGGDGVNDASALSAAASESRWAPGPTSPWRAPGSPAQRRSHEHRQSRHYQC